jgi:predicted GH43/DUF377 family glycosyl hydrolase
MKKKIIGVFAVCTLASLLVVFGFKLYRPSVASTYFALAQSANIPSNAPLTIDSVDPTPCLTRGTIGAWDSGDLLNPSVIRFKGHLFNYYSGFDGKVWHTGVALSDDGVLWKKYDKNPILSPSQKDWDVSYISANGSAVLWGQKVLYFYQGVDSYGVTNIGLATSEDGFTFSKLPKPVLAIGPLHTWDSAAVGDPYVIAKGDTLYLYYLGQNDRFVQRLGVARSKDGIRWEKLISNPVLEVGAAGTFDENGLGEPSVTHVPPYFYLIYTGRDAKENRNIGYAISTDGVNWKKMSTRGLLSSEQRGNWASSVVCDTTLLSKGNGKFLVWFGGGNKPDPAQNLNGEVGLLTLDLGQNRNMSEFDANAEWELIRVKSTDILSGSYGIEGDAGKRFTWVGPKASISLLTESNQKEKALVVRGWIPAKEIADVTKQSTPTTISLITKGRTLSRINISKDQEFVISVPCFDLWQLFAPGEIIDLEINASKSFVPAQLGKSSDLRDLALMITAIRFE